MIKMTPQEKQDLENVKREIELLKRGQNIEIASGLERLFSTTFLSVKDRSAVTDSAVSETLNLTGLAQSIDVLRFPDRWIYVYLDGKLHRLGAWLTEFDN